MLLEVAGEPLLGHGLRALVGLGVEEIVLVVGHGAATIEARYGDRFEDCPLVYLHQVERRGLADALLATASRIGGPFVALHGDNLFVEGSVALHPIVERRREEGLAASLAVERVPPELAELGVCMTAPDGRVERVVEHPSAEERRAGLVVGGFYAFSPIIFEACRAIEPSARGEYELPDALTWLVRHGHRVAASPLRGTRVNVNTPHDLERARALLEGRALRSSRARSRAAT